MFESNLSYRCYILPIVAGAGYLILTSPLIYSIVADWIPYEPYAQLVRALLLLILVFIACRLHDIFCHSCHDNNCVQCPICNKDAENK